MKITTRMVGAEAKKARKNPIGRQETYVLAEENLATLKKRYQTLLLTMADLRDSLRRRKKGLPDDDMRGYTDAEISKLIKHYQTRAEDLRGAIAEYESGNWWKNPARKAAKMKANPDTWGTAPLGKVRSVIARQKATGELPTFLMADTSGKRVPTPYHFAFRLNLEGENFDFVGRYSGPLLIVSEKSTGLRLPGDVPFSKRAAYNNDKEAAKSWTLDLIERVGARKLVDKVKASR